MNIIYKERIAKARSILKERGVDSVLFFSRENIRYLCGFTGSFGNLLCTLRSNHFFTDARYLEQAGKEVKGAKIHLAKNGIVDICRFISSNGVKKVGIESTAVSYHDFTVFKKSIGSAKVYPLMKEFHNFRAVKDSDELSRIEGAIKIAERSLEETLKLIRTGVSEMDIAVELEYRMKLNGSEELPFNVIVLFGENTSLPHGKPGKRRLKKGDLILIDFGARYGGYCSDETVTFVYGRPDQEQVRIHNAVNDARRYAIDLMCEGRKASDVDNIARKYLREKGLGKFFGHGLGHGVGLAVHEDPRLSNKSEDLLSSSMVVTVEPGVYIQKWGGVRLEDMVVVKKNGAKILTGLKKQIRMLEG